MCILSSILQYYIPTVLWQNLKQPHNNEQTKHHIHSLIAVDYKNKIFPTVNKKNVCFHINGTWKRFNRKEWDKRNVGISQF